jgi:hypothetical protein
LAADFSFRDDCLRDMALPPRFKENAFGIAVSWIVDCDRHSHEIGKLAAHKIERLVNEGKEGPSCPDQ